MRPRILILTLALSLQPLALVWAPPFYYQGLNADGSANTNPVTMTAYPAATNTWTAYGTNIVYGGLSITITPDTNGYASNYALPNSYRCIVSNVNSAFYVSLEDTTNFLSLASYIQNAPTITGAMLTDYGLVTNWLSFAPATNSNAGIDAALGFEPATNSFGGVTNLLGYTPATNSFGGITNLLGYTPATNSFGSITNLLGYTPATNLATVFSTNLQVIVAGDVTNTLYFTNGLLGGVTSP